MDNSSVSKSVDLRSQNVDSPLKQKARSQSKNVIDASQYTQQEVELIKPIQEATNTTEFLMLTLQKALNYQPSQVQELLTNTNQYLMQACDKGIKGDFTQVLNWFASLILHMPKMIQLFRIAYAQNSALEVTLVLSSIRCGFFSQNQQVCAISIEVLERISEDFYQKPIEIGLQVQKYKNKQKYYGANVAEIQIRVFQQFQEWFVRSTKPPKSINKRYTKAGNQYQHLGDPSSVMRVACTEVLQNHQDLSANVTRLILSIFRDPTITPSPITLKNLPELLAEVLADDVYLCYEALSVILPCIRDFDRGSLQKILVESDIIIKLLELSSEQTQDPAVRLQCTTLLFDLWYLEPIIVCNPREGIQVKEKINEVILAGLLHQDKVYRLTIYGCAFSVLTLLIDLKSPEAPALLKTIITGILNHMSGPFRKDKITQEFVLKNLIDLFQSRPDIPVTVLIEPVTEIFTERLKGEQAQSGGKIKSGNLSNEEINFLIKMSGHHKLTISTVTPLLQLFVTLYMTKPLIASSIQSTIVYLVDRFFEKSKSVKSFVTNDLIKKALAAILSLRKEEQLLNSGSIRPLAITSAGAQLEVIAKKPRHFIAQEKQAAVVLTRKIQRFNLVKLVEFIYQLNLHQVQETIAEQVKLNSDKYFTVFKMTSSAYDYLIKCLGLNIQSQNSYGGEVANPDNRNSEYQYSNDPSYQNGVLMLRSNSQEILDRKRLEKEKVARNRQRQLQWSEVKDPSNEIALRAIEEMQQIKQQRIRKQNAERIEEIQKKEKMEKLIDSSTTDVAMRNLILQKEAAQRKNRIKDILSGKYLTEQSQANASPIVYNPFHPNILNEMQRPSIKSPVDERELKVILSLSRVQKDGIVLINFEFEEEERERDTMRLLVFRYQNLFRYLFNKYSSIGQVNKRSSGMEIIKVPLITIVEVMKFLKENGVDASLISQREVGILMKIINDCMFLRHAGTALDFAGFVQLIIQASIFIYRKGRVKEISAKQALSLLCHDLVKLTLQRFQDQALKRGESGIIYETPLAMQSLNGDIDEKQAQALKNANQSKNPLAVKLNFSTNQSRVVAVDVSYKPNQNLKMIMGDAKFNVLEILNELMQNEFGICLFEGIMTAKEKVELSILPQMSGLPLQSVVDQKQKTSKVPEKVPSQATKSTDVKKSTDKSKDTKGQAAQQLQQRHPPPNFEIYSVEQLVKRLPQRPQQIRNARLDKENEQILMEAPWTPAIKVACFELQQIKPQSLLTDMREVAQLLEEILMCTAEHKTYLSLADRKLKKQQKAITRITQKFNEQIQLTPQVNIESKKKREDLQKAKREQEEEQKQLKNIEFAKRGLLLKEQVQVLKQQKEEKEVYEKQIKEAQEEEERAKKEKIDEKLKRFQEKENRERNARAEAKALKENQEKFKAELDGEYEKKKQTLAEETNKCILDCRKRYAQEHGEDTEPYQSRKAKELLDYYRQASTTVALQEAEPVFKKAFQQVIEQQNVTSRLHGSPLHKGLNLDGVISLCIRCGVIPNLIAVDDLIQLIKMQLRDRQYMPLDLQNDQSSMAVIATNPTPMQLINFENKGGHCTYEEFSLILVRSLLMAHKYEALEKQVKSNINQQVMASPFYQKALSLNYQQQSWELIEKILNCQQQIETFNRINIQLNVLGQLYVNQTGGKPKFYSVDIKPSNVTSQDFNDLIDFLVETLKRFKLTKLPLKASSYQPVVESPNRPAILNRRSNSVSASMDQVVFKSLQKQKLENKISNLAPEVDNYRIPVKTDILKAKAVNTKRASQPQMNQDLKPVSVEVKKQTSIVGTKFQQLSSQKPTQVDQNYANEYQDPLGNSEEDTFADYSMMLSPSKR